MWKNKTPAPLKEQKNPKGTREEIGVLPPAVMHAFDTNAII